MWKSVVFAIVLLAAPAVAQAAPLSFYLGGSLGSGVDLDADDLGLSDFGTEDGDQTWKAFGGLRFGRIFGVEAAWHDFGNVVCCSQVADAGFDVDVEGVSVAAVAGFPIQRLRLFAKAGVIAWEVDGDVITFAGPLPFSADGEDLMGGIGAAFEVTKRFALRAEWEIFEIADGSLDSASAGIELRF